MAKYPHTIDGKNLNRISRDKVEIWRNKGKIAQHGIMYPKSDPGTAVLSSNSQEDIEKILKNGCWAHTKCPRRISAGTKVVIVPSQKVIDELGDDAWGVEFEASGKPYQVTAKTHDWPSE